MNLQDYLRRQRERIDSELAHLLADPERIKGVPPNLLEALRYSVLDGGKRIRPILVLAAAEAVGGDSEAAIPAACAIELIHTFSLIHDDLPCMDNDDLRRGKPTSHKVFGEAMALLAGDALLVLAFEVLMSMKSDAGTVRACAQEIARATGLRGMVGGQVVDMELSHKDASLQEVESMHRRKTGALIEASTVVGGIIGGASAEAIESLREYGRAVGLAFQIRDDILDAASEAGSDERNEKATYPRLLGLDRAREMAREAAERGTAVLSALDSRADPLRQIAGFIADRDL